MNNDVLMALQLFCMGVLFAQLFSLLQSKRQTMRNSALLCAAVLLLIAVILRVMIVSNEGADSEVQNAVLSAIRLAAAGLSGTALLASVLMEIRNSGVFPWKELLIVCVPPWLYGLFSMITKTDFQFTEALTLSLLLGCFLYQRDAEREINRREEKMERVQMTLLEEQVRPHFIFNSLSSIRRLCTSDPPLAARALDDFAGYLRNDLDALSASHMIPFEKELEFIEQYAALEKLNPAQQFEMVYDLAVVDFSIPALSIQPLVENAILHGIRPGSSDAMVILSTQRQGEAVQVIVEDNGAGFPKGVTAEQKEHANHGLGNVRQRLESQCGGTLHISSDENGTRVVVLIPLRRMAA